MAVDLFLATTLSGTFTGNLVGVLGVQRALGARGRAARAVLGNLAGWILGIVVASAAVRTAFGPAQAGSLMPDLEAVLAAGWGLLFLAVLAVGRSVWRARERTGESVPPAA